MTVISLLAVLMGVALGAVLGFLFARSRAGRAPPPACKLRQARPTSVLARPTSGPRWSTASSPSGSRRCRRRRSSQHQAVP